MTQRKMKPAAPVALQAAFVSQLTCLPLLGVNERRFLDVVVPLCRADVVHVGKLRLVPIDVAIARLRALAANDDGAERTEAKADQDDDDEPTTAAGVLAKLGLERV